MAGAPSRRAYTMEEVMGMLDSVDEPICDGSDDDLGMQLEETSSESDSDQER